MNAPHVQAPNLPQAPAGESANGVRIRANRPVVAEPDLARPLVMHPSEKSRPCRTRTCNQAGMSRQL